MLWYRVDKTNFTIEPYEVSRVTRGRIYRKIDVACSSRGYVLFEKRETEGHKFFEHMEDAIAYLVEYVQVKVEIAKAHVIAMERRYIDAIHNIEILREAYKGNHGYKNPQQILSVDQEPKRGPKHSPVIFWPGTQNRR